MDATSEVKDHLGRTVCVGSRVQIIGLAVEFLDSLPDDERPLVAGMVGEIVEVDEIDKFGAAWVTKWWHHDDGTHDAHGVGLSASEMELVSDEN
jgi:hypothetical protein